MYCGIIHLWLAIRLMRRHAVPIFALRTMLLRLQCQFLPRIESEAADSYACEYH